MGRQKHLQLKGTFENVIYYQRWGVGYMRSKPTHVHQSAATRRASFAFGKVMSISRVIRRELQPVLPALPGKTQQYLVDKAVRAWLQTGAVNSVERLENLAFINALEFNPGCEVLQRLHLPFNVHQLSNELELNSPSFSPKQKIAAPPSTTQVLCTLMATSICLDTLQANSTPVLEWVINFNNDTVAANTLQFPLQVFPGQLALLVLNVCFLNTNNLLQQGAAVLWSSWGGGGDAAGKKNN
jgi:hypothetical protein